MFGGTIGLWTGVAKTLSLITQESIAVHGDSNYLKYRKTN